ncbi:TIGR01777 family oxidoreductase [Mucilaginibacter aquaedulcis]|uniref:TIGR01777 family oxidoreductase n=1 Tax=Mucilaginibacter aquaedulcis TaxID=1187081 RepID=UPI0025B42EE2|nr:TIGR01777 family oxidoreductase [Mucilaginibacter aquaedulcis]MDN3549720.1 TIGR01777 family oxidoreductase [Mucilaginibacter aquaedulcis]
MSLKKHILITGGSGLLGRQLTKALLNKGYTVSHLSRKPGNNPNIKTYVWDVDKSIIDEHCIEGVDTIVHLAGTGIAEKRWTDARKKKLIDSRTKSIGLIYELLKKTQHQVTAVVSASGIGYYSNRGDELMTETDTPANDFIAHCCVLWEAAVDEGEKLGLRVLKFRTGVVLDKDGGALPTLAKPIRFYIGSALGNGKQWVPWIHWLDVVNMYLHGIENTGLKGVYNMVAPNPVTNLQLTRAVAKQLQKPLWAPKVPAFVLKLLLGEMSSVVLGSTRVSAQKIQDAGFKFSYTELPAALKEIYG